jgi:hypothetical protein
VLADCQIAAAGAALVHCGAPDKDRGVGRLRRELASMQPICDLDVALRGIGHGVDAATPWPLGNDLQICNK